VLVPKWHHAFSQLAAEARFAVLGVVLLAVLSQVCEIVGITKAYDEIGQVEVEKVLLRFGEEAWGQDERGDDEAVKVEEAGSEDVGEVVERDSVPKISLEDTPATLLHDTEIESHLSDHRGEDSSRPQLEIATATDDKPPEAVKPTKPKENLSTTRPKKRRKKNAIDDLFSGF